MKGRRFRILAASIAVLTGNILLSNNALAEESNSDAEVRAGVMAAICNDPYRAKACADMQSQQAQTELNTIETARASHSVASSTLTEVDRDAIIQRVKASLRDPDSAEFRNLAAYNDARLGKVICGEVNAKNAYGGYVGYLAFIYKSNDAGSPTIEFDDDAHLVAQSCRIDAAVAAP